MNNKENFTVLDFINNEFPDFATIEDCKKYILDNFTDESEGIHPDIDDIVICENILKVFVDEENNCEIKLIPISEVPDNEKENTMLFVSWLMDNCDLAEDNSLWSYNGEDYTNEKLFDIFHNKN